MNKLGFILTSLVVALAIASSMLFVVDQRQFGVVFQLGQIKQVVVAPGLNFKLPPPFQNVSYIDKRLLSLESTYTEPMLTAEKQRVVIDWYVRWRIIDPSQYIRNVGLDERHQRARWRVAAQPRGAQLVSAGSEPPHRQRAALQSA